MIFLDMQKILNREFNNNMHAMKLKICLLHPSSLIYSPMAYTIYLFLYNILKVLFIIFNSSIPASLYLSPI